MIYLHTKFHMPDYNNLSVSVSGIVNMGFIRSYVVILHSA